jgi:DNA polymerase III epsilon subunit-like protein
MNTIKNFHNRNYVLVFDTETTGLMPKKNKDSPVPIPLSEYPHILQLSYILYDTINNKFISIYDSYVNVDESVEISEFITGLTGITDEMCKTRGKDIVDVLIDFYQAYKYTNCLVGHNIYFDEEIIMVELKRNQAEIMRRAPECFTMFNKTYERMANIDRYCTMMKGTNLCNILVVNEEGKPPRKKWPKLAELFSKLFEGEVANGLHNSMIDVITCLRCYMKMQYSRDLEVHPQN